MYSFEITVDRGRDPEGRPRPPCLARLWIPPECRIVRGIIIGQMTLIEKQFMTDPWIRDAAAGQQLAVVFLDPGFDAMFNDVERDAGGKLERILAELASVSGRPELARALMLTVGHSTAGIFARNIAYWRPDRVFGVIHIKSGNLHQHIYGTNRTLAGIPFLAINGQLEEHGPEGGIRLAYGLETQWIMMRSQLLDRRRQDERNLMSLLVDPGAGHRSWDESLSRCCALFIRKAAQAMLPKEGCSGTRKKLDPKSGWLSDSELAEPAHPPAPYSRYSGDRAAAFWHLDKEMALAVEAFHRSTSFRKIRDGDGTIDFTFSAGMLEQLGRQSGYWEWPESAGHWRLFIDRGVYSFLEHNKIGIRRMLSDLTESPLETDFQWIKGCNGLKLLQTGRYRIVFDVVENEHTVWVLAIDENPFRI